MNTQNQTAGQTLGRSGSFTLLFAATFTVMVGSLITPSLPAIAAHLGFSRSPGWLLTLPSLGVVLFGPVAGRCIERLGPRRAMLAGLLLYGLFGVAAMLLLFSRIAVIADRLLLGGATAVVMASGTMLIAEHFHGEQRLRMIAWQGMAIEVGGVIFLSLGGLLGELSWRMPFALYLLAWPCIALALRCIPADTRTSVLKQDAAVRHGSVFSIFVAAFCAMALFFTAYITLPASLALRFQMSQAATGAFMALISLVAVVVAGCLPFLTRVIRVPWLLALAFLMLGFGHLLFACATGFVVLALGAVAMGAGFAFAIPIANHLLVHESPAASRARNLGYLSMAIFLGQFASTFLTLLTPDAKRLMCAAGLGSTAIGIVWCGWELLRSRRSRPDLR